MSKKAEILNIPYANKTPQHIEYLLATKPFSRPAKKSHLAGQTIIKDKKHIPARGLRPAPPPRSPCPPPRWAAPLSSLRPHRASAPEGEGAADRGIKMELRRIEEKKINK